MPRILMDKNNRESAFKELKKMHNAGTYSELAEKLGVPFKSLQKWTYGERLIPANIFPKKLLKKVKIIATKEDNWGLSKGGKASIKKMRELYPSKISEWTAKGGKNAWKTLRGKVNESDFYIITRKNRLQKTMAKLIEKTNSWKTASKSKLMVNKIKYSREDIKRSLKLPDKLTEELAEEIGMHLGDGTLSAKKHYFSVRGDIKEEAYYANFVLPLYKKIYNLDLKLLKKYNVCGFEISSKGLYEFKSKTLGFVSGEKAHRIKIPEQIIQSNDKGIFAAFLRGVFDTDGCVYIVKKKKYPSVSITITSKKAITQITKMLEKMGFAPYLSLKNYSVTLYGTHRVKKWFDEIGSHNPKHLKRFEVIKSVLPWDKLEEFYKENINTGPVV